MLPHQLNSSSTAVQQQCKIKYILSGQHSRLLVQMVAVVEGLVKHFRNYANLLSPQEWDAQVDFCSLHAEKIRVLDLCNKSVSVHHCKGAVTKQCSSLWISQKYSHGFRAATVTWNRNHLNFLDDSIRNRIRDRPKALTPLPGKSCEDFKENQF